MSSSLEAAREPVLAGSERTDQRVGGFQKNFRIEKFSMPGDR